MYVFVRLDLSSAQRIVQATHAAIEATRYLLPVEFDHPHLVLIGLSDQEAFTSLCALLERNQINYRLFFEPDLNNELTALAT